MKNILLPVACFFLLVFPLCAQEDSLNLPLDKAFVFFREKVKANPESPYASYGLARCYFLSEDYRKAASLSKKFISHKTDYRNDFLLLYARSLLALGSQDKAIHVLSEAICEAPENVLFYYYRAIAYYKNGDVSRAINDVLTCTRLKETFSAAHLLLGCLLYEKNNDRRAAIPLYYALFGNAKAPWAAQATYMIYCLLAFRHENLVVPFREERLKIREVEDILACYCSSPAYKEWQPSVEHFVPSTTSYLLEVAGNLRSLASCYDAFFSSLVSSPHLVTFSYYLLTSFSLPEVQEWYKTHSQELSSFAEWIDRVIKE